ncbi:MAG: universal stress protein [Steroidobacteraceae bacterium]|jgi:universal stress protein E
MPLRIRRILIAVADGAATRVVRRAGDLAVRAHAKVELLSVIRPDSTVLGLPNATLLQINRAIAESRARELEKLAGRLRRRGIEVSCTVVTNDSLSESIVKRLKEAPADLVAIEAHKHSLLARWFLLQSDYELIRHCPVPLLIVKTMSTANRRPVLAALDPWHQNDKPASLDSRIVDAGRTVSNLLNASLHSAHAYSPLLGLVSDSAFAPVAIPISPPQEEAHARTIRRRFKALNARYRIVPRQGHLQVGDARYVLPALARSLKAQMVVMGAISRTALDRLLLGSTAEQVLDALPCDVLVVKPKSTGPVRRRK